MGHQQGYQRRGFHRPHCVQLALKLGQFGAMIQAHHALADDHHVLAAAPRPCVKVDLLTVDAQARTSRSLISS